MKSDWTVRIDWLIVNAPNECKENIVIPNRIIWLWWVSEINSFWWAWLSWTLTFQQPSHITKIWSNAFVSNNLKWELILPEWLVGEIWEKTFYWNKFEWVLVIPSE